MSLKIRRYSADLSKIVFISNSLSGHRLTWFLNLYQLQAGSKKPIQVIFKGEISSISIDSNNFQFHVADSNQQAIKIAENLFKMNDSLVFIFLDGEQWLRFLIRTHIPAKVLVMRPFVSTFKISALIKFSLKLITITLFKLKRNLRIRYLKIPHYTPKLRKLGWINDNLTTSDLHATSKSKEVKRNVINILVPGFINERKNPEFILDIAANLEDNFPGSFQFRFLGSIDIRTKNLIDVSNLGNVSYEDQYFARSEYLNRLNEADLILLFYKNRSASGIIMEALALNKTVLIYKSYLWSNLQRIASGKLVFISKKHNKAFKQFESLMYKEIQRNLDTSSTKYEFLDQNDSRGLINFIFTL